MGQRQDTGNDSAALGDQIGRRVAEGAFENPLPTGEMEERSARMSEHELVPALLVTRPEQSYSET